MLVLPMLILYLNSARDDKKEGLIKKRAGIVREEEGMQGGHCSTELHVLMGFFKWYLIFKMLIPALF